MRATRAVIHLDNLRNNLSAIRNRVGGGVRICLAVKADAYGHGAVMVSKTAISAGVDVLAVATADEAFELRSGGIAAPLLVLGLPLPEEIPLVLETGAECMVSDTVLAGLFAAEAEKRGVRAGLHIKVDTGMGRIGCSPDQALPLAEYMDRSEAIRIAGLCTHFPLSDTGDGELTRRQTRMIGELVSDFRRHGIDPGTVHAANSGAVIDCPESWFDMVRPGILAYGYYPSSDQERSIGIRPVMEFKTKIVHLKRVAKGTGISYGHVYRAPRDTVIATLPVGYADGYSRILTGSAEVTVGGTRHPVVGTICMDQCMVDLGPDTDARLYDDVILFGPEAAGPDAEDVARAMGTIPYEVTCSVAKRVPRVYEDAVIYKSPDPPPGTFPFGGPDPSNGLSPLKRSCMSSSSPKGSDIIA